MADGRTNYSEAPCWSTLPDGPCEHIANTLPRIVQLACRLVCRSWRSSFVHSLAPLTIDTRFFAAHGGPEATPAPCPPTPSTHLAPPSALGPTWDSLTASIGPTFRSITVRVALLHESKARAAPCVDSCVACLRYLASLPRYDHSHLQLLLPLRYALPHVVTDVLSSSLCRLRSLRLVRCSLTQQLAGVLGGMPHLRHLCIAHANLAALPQLLQAATLLEHIHVHGYHSLVIVEDNAHQLAAWRAAVALVEGSQVEEGSSGVGSGSPGRLCCLAVSAHHLNHDTVLDETELDFEAEALRWQIRYDRSSGGAGCGSSGPAGDWLYGSWDGSAADGTGSGGAEEEAQAPLRAGCCCHDPHEDPRGPTERRGGSASRSYMGGGSGDGALCAAVLVGISCACLSGGAHCAGGSRSRSGGAGTAEATAGAQQTTLVPRAGGSTRDHLASGLRAGAAGAGGDASGGAPQHLSSVRLQLLKSGKREVCLHPPELLLAAVRQPYWRHLQYAQLALIPGPAPPPPPPPPPPRCSGTWGRGAAVGRAAVTAVATTTAAAKECAVDRGGSMAGREQEVLGEANTGSSASDEMIGGGVHVVTLEPLNELPALTGVWLDPDEWDGEEAEASAGQDGGGEGLVEQHEMNLVPGPALAAKEADALGEGGRDADGVSEAGHLGSSPAGGRPALRWGRMGDVWVLLHEPPSADAAHSPVQDALTHAALLTSCSRLRSLALGDRRTPFLGIGDDTAELLSRLAGLTKLHLSAAYSLPLTDAQPSEATLSRPEPWAGGAAGRSPLVTPPAASSGTSSSLAGSGCREAPAAWLRLPPRLAPLGALTALRRLGLHFSNPLGRPAVVSYAALPSSLTSLSLHGVVLVLGDSAAAAGPRPGYAGAVARAAAPAEASGAAAYLAPAAAAIANAQGGISLPCLRDLSLRSSYIERADLLGCGPRLRLVSLRDSGVGNGGDVSAGLSPPDDGLVLAGLLRTWHGVQTLRVVGSTATSADIRLPVEDCCMSWYSTSGLRAIARCLPCLRMLHLGPPEASCLAAARSRPQSQPAAAAAAPSLLPLWHLSTLPDAVGTAIGTGTGTGTSSGSTTTSVAAQWAGPAVAGPTEAVAPMAAAAAPADLPADWLTSLLHLLCRHTQHLRCLRVSCVAAYRDAAEAAVRTAHALLPSQLPYLEQLAVVLDLPMSYVLAEQQPELYARGWAAWLRRAEEDLQSRMRYTCVAMSPHPSLASRARDAARGLVPRQAAQQDS